MIKPKITYVTGEKEKTIGKIRFHRFCKDKNYRKPGFSEYSELIFDEEVESVCIENMIFDKSLECCCDSTNTKVTFKDCEFKSTFLGFNGGNYQLIRPKFFAFTRITVGGKSFEMHLLKDAKSNIDGSISVDNILITNIKPGSTYTLYGENISLVNSDISALSRVQADQFCVSGMVGNVRRLSIETGSLAIQNSKFSMGHSQVKYKEIGVFNSSITLEENCRFNNIEVKDWEHPLTITGDNIETIAAHSNLVAVLREVDQKVTEQVEPEKQKQLAPYRDIYEAAKLAYQREITNLDNIFADVEENIGNQVGERKVKELIRGKKS